ncbi:unnamed protein product, partial [Ectocarpus sp. 12 AP-2014]
MTQICVLTPHPHGKYPGDAPMLNEVEKRHDIMFLVRVKNCSDIRSSVFRPNWNKAYLCNFEVHEISLFQSFGSTVDGSRCDVIFRVCTDSIMLFTLSTVMG